MKSDFKDGDAKILDCAHDFGAHLFVRIRDRWVMVTVIDVPEAQRAGARKVGMGALMCSIHQGVTHCFCGQALDGTAPVRNYVRGRNAPADELLDDLVRSGRV